MTLFIRFTLILSLLASVSQAQFRKYSNEFLAIGVGARSLGMSGAQVASVNDVYGTYWNPASLNEMDGSFSAAFMHAEYFAGIAKYDYGAVVMPISGGDKRLAFSLIRFGVDDIPNTLFLKEPDGSINYDNVTTFSAANYAFFASFAGKLKKEGLQYGLNAKVVHNNVGHFAQSWGVGVDAGAQYLKKNWRFGVMLRDVTTTYNAWSFDFTEEEAAVLQNTGNVVPSSSTELTAPKLIIGAAYNVEIGKKISLQPELDFEVTTDGKRNVLLAAKPFSLDPKVGVEASYAKIVYLRAGVGNFQRATSDVDASKITTVQPNIGVGLKIKAVSIDYALTDLGNLSQSLYSHVFSIKLDLHKNPQG